MSNGVQDPIIIKGGSVKIEFDEGTYTGGNGSYKNARRKIVSVEVIDDNTGQAQSIPVPANGRCTITINTR